MNTIDENKFIVIVPTVNISNDFYNQIIPFLSSLMIDLSICNELVYLCVKDGAFEEFKKAFINNINLIITTYSTASWCLGSLYEFMNHQNKMKKNFDIISYSLIIDEARMLLNNTSLIVIRDFDKVGLISATIQDISSLSIFQDYYIITPYLSTQYERDLYVHQLNTDDNKTRQSVIDLIHRERLKYDKVTD